MTTSLAGAGPLAGSNDPGSANRGICTLTFQDRIFRFRTNPNEVWWTSELITKVEQTYGGRVVQILGTRLGDLNVKVECGLGGWKYLMQVVTFLRDVLNDQRNGDPATFEYTTRNWKLKVYSLSIPFENEVTAVARELNLQFKIQEDVTGVVSRASLAADLARLQDGVYRVGQNVHNQYNDFTQIGVPLQGTNNRAPQARAGIPNTENTVDSNPLGKIGTGSGLPDLANIPGISMIPGLGPILAGMGG